jgi:phosphatidylserine/phosphatidylglycerophosphate/cardiolipin synthase-like enzyme
VSGFALGGGCELAMACDIIIASESARFGQPEINIGVIPGAGGTQRLTRAVGKCKAMEMVLTGAIISAEEALRWGLVNKVVPVEYYLQEAKALAREIASKAPVAVRLGKESVLKSFDGSMEAGLEYERKNFYLLFATSDQKEGMKAFSEKRTPNGKATNIFHTIFIIPGFIMRTTIFLLFLFSFSVLVHTQTTSNFELVESTPIETSLDNPDIRNAYPVWMEMIGNATKSLDIEEFYVSNQAGEPLDSIIIAIEKAAERGVRVRLMADSRMYKTYPETINMLDSARNVTVRIIDYGKLGGGIQHSKYFIVDNEQIYLGSQNFDWRSLKHIHELGVQIKQTDAVNIYQDIFDLDWQLAEKNDPAEIKKVLRHKLYHVPLKVSMGAGDTLEFIPTMSPRQLIPDTSLWDEKNIIDLIDRAKQEVSFQVLTYSPVARDKTYYAELDNALRRAAVRGVKVKMIVSDWSKDHPTIDYLKSLSVVPNIQVKLSEIPDWSGGYVPFARVEHCKYLVIDSSACWIGTSNWEKSYFYNTRNLGVVVLNGKFARRVRDIFYKGWNSPYTSLVKPEVDYKPRRHGEN